MATLIRLKQIESGSALDTAAQIGTDFSGAVYEIIDASGLFSSSAQVDLLSASNYDGFVVQLDMTMSSDLEASVISSSISQSLNILSQTYVTTASLNTLSASIVTSISSSDAIFAEFSNSIDDTILNKMNIEAVISSSAQLTGATLKGITIAPIDSDSYSLIISGAVAVVNAVGLNDGGYDADIDSTVPAQIYLNGNPTSASVIPVDPSTGGEANSNIIDMGDF